MLNRDHRDAIQLKAVGNDFLKWLPILIGRLAAVAPNIYIPCERFASSPIFFPRTTGTTATLARKTSRPGAGGRPAPGLPFPGFLFLFAAIYFIVELLGKAHTPP